MHPLFAYFISKRISYARDALVNAAGLVENSQSYLNGYVGMLPARWHWGIKNANQGSFLI